MLFSPGRKAELIEKVRIYYLEQEEGMFFVALIELLIFQSNRSTVNKYDSSFLGAGEIFHLKLFTQQSFCRGKSHLKQLWKLFKTLLIYISISPQQLL